MPKAPRRTPAQTPKAPAHFFEESDEEGNPFGGAEVAALQAKMASLEKQLKDNKDKAKKPPPESHLVPLPSPELTAGTLSVNASTDAPKTLADRVLASEVRLPS